MSDAFVFYLPDGDGRLELLFAMDAKGRWTLRAIRQEKTDEGTIRVRGIGQMDVSSTVWQMVSAQLGRADESALDAELARDEARGAMRELNRYLARAADAGWLDVVAYNWIVAYITDLSRDWLTEGDDE